MISAPETAQEGERQARLENYRVLDTSAETRYDDIAWLASYICETPIALVSLVDKRRQWFKARVGMPVQQTSREIAFCAHAIQSDGLFIVPDAQKDVRFATNPLVTQEPHVRFYAGAPLMTPDGHAIGTLCVIDAQPRTLTPEQMHALGALSRQVVAQMELTLQLREIEATNLALARTNRALNGFTSAVSHDLQEPLRKIQALGDRLEKLARPLLPTDLQDYLDRMLRAAVRMDSLIVNLLSYVRLQKPEAKRLPIPLGDIVNTVLEDMSERIADTGATVDVQETLPVVRANAVQMQQLFQNLLANALKFRRAGVAPQITVRGEVVGKGDGQFAVVTVRDNGVGFANEYAERIFEPFERLEARSRFEGTGLGLAICREIARQHDGTLVADAKPGQGAAFTVRLPLATNADSPETDRK